jgi:hypothetical protein
MIRFYASPARLLAGIFFLLFLGACATPQTRHVLEHRPAGLPQRVELATVPFFPQEEHQCGPAALATVLGDAGTAVMPDTLAQEVYLPGREGSVQVEMLAATRRNGLVAYELPPSLDALLTEVAGGTPVIVLQNLAFNWYPLWHYAVVVGYDLNRQEMVLRSGREKRQILPMTTFERTWARARFWAMAALPPAKLPRTATEDVYVASAVALEKTGKTTAANKAYATALRKWPNNLAALIGLGNTSYALGNLWGAERAFRQATVRHADSGVAFNNLAQVLSDLKHYRPALEAAREAVNLGGPQLETYQETLTQIQKKLRN